MTLIKKGSQAKENIMKEGNEGQQQNSRQISTFKSGTTYKVRIPSTEDFAEWHSHSVFGKFYSGACTGKEDLYCQAVKLIYDEMNEEKKKGNDDKAEELRKEAYELKAKPRYLFGFFNLEDGEPIVIDVSKKQAQVLITGIDKMAKNLSKYPFEVTKSGQGQSTQVSITPILSAEDELTEQELKNFQETEGKEFPAEIYEEVLKVKSRDEQIEDLKTYGFDVSRLGVKDENEDVPF